MTDPIWSSLDETSALSPEPTVVVADQQEDLAVALGLEDRLNAALALVWSELASGASEPGFLELLAEVFGASPEAAEALAARLVAGDTLGLRYEIETGEEMAGTFGAYAALGDDGVATIYLNGDWLAAASDAEIRMVLLEEIGHSFDTVLNGDVDTPGDEGELFALLLSGAELSEEERAAILAEDDSGAIVVDGQLLSVEFDRVTSITAVTLSADNGVSTTDRVTNVGAQTVTVLTANAGGNPNADSAPVLYYSLDGGATRVLATLVAGSWANNGNNATTASFTFSVVLSGAGSLTFYTASIGGSALPLTGTSAPNLVTTFAYVIDVAPPASPTLTLAEDSGPSSDDGVTNNGTVNVYGLEANAAWEYRIDGGSWTVGTGSSFVLAEGSYGSGAIQVRQKDVAGNVSSEGSNDSAITVDATVAPPTLELRVDSGGSNGDGITNDGTVTVNGLETGALWEYRIDGGSWTAGTGSAMVLAEGRYASGAIEVRQIDPAGNRSSVGSNTAEIQVDLTPPETPELQLSVDSGASNSDGLTSDGTVNVTGLEAGATWEYRIDDGTWTTGSGSTLTVSGDGQRTVLVRQTDVAGNLSASQSLTFRLDTEAPSPAVALSVDSGAADDDGLTNDGALTFSELEEGATRVITVNGEEVESYSPPTVDGPYTVVVTDTDGAGNSASASVTFRLDRTGPIFTTSAPQSITAGGTLLYDATTDDELAGTVSYALEGDPEGLTIDAATGQVSLITGDLAVGQTHAFTVLATDAAGNVSEQAAAIEVIEGVLTGSVEGIKGYDLDRSREGLQFKVVATPDLRASTGEVLYKIRSVGHIAMGVAVRVGDGGELALDLPEGFVLSGPNAVELFDTGAKDGLTGQLVMGRKVAQYGAEALEASGRRLQLASELDRDGNGMVYARVRMTMQALSSTGYAKGETLSTADATDGLDLLIHGGEIANMNRFTFSARYLPGGEASASQEDGQGTVLGTAVLENVNEFKRSKGLGGLVRSAADGTGVAGAQVGLRLKGSSRWIDANGTAAGAFMQADADGWFLSEFQHSGKQATYQLGLVNSSGQFVAGSVREVVLGGGIHFATAELLA